MEKIKNMTATTIIKALNDAGISQAGIARDLSKSPVTVRQVIKGDCVSHTVRTHIAKCINMDVREIWPETYLVKDDPTRKGRPLSKGYFDTQAA